MRPIAHIVTDLPQKFGIPRQSGLAPSLEGRVVFEPEYALEGAVRGLEGFTHIWLIWGFENGEAGGAKGDIATDMDAEKHRSDELRTVESWSPTVRPPRLGGNERMGVFATRSPFRPNPIGLSCVRLERVEIGTAGPVLHVRGADLRNGTPIYDVKPYIPYADCHPEASGGFTDAISFHAVTDIEFPDELLTLVPENKQAGLMELLREDPRPPYHNDPKRIYGMGYAGLEVRFTVGDGVLHVVEVEAL